MVEYDYICGNTLCVTDETRQINPYTWEEDSIHEFSSIETFFAKLKQTSVVLDIGSQSGAYALGAKFYPETTWFAFEPDPTNYQLLVDNLALNHVSNVTAKNMALSSKQCEMTLNICAEHRGLNTLGDNLIRFDEQQCETVSVAVDTIDALFSNQEINLIKIDTEGSEYDVLLGGSETITQYKPEIFLEYNEQNLLQCKRSKAELDALIKRLGYKISKRVGENIWIAPKSSWRRFF